MRRLAIVGFSATLLFAADLHADPWAAPSWAPPEAADIRCSAQDVLPAGIYHRGVGWYDFHLDGCPAPAVAVAAGVHPSAARAQAAARAHEHGLAPGYPWVVHTRAAGLSGDGIAVVLAQWATAEQALAWRDEHAPGAQLLDVLAEAPAIARFHADNGGRETTRIPHVVHVTSATPAYTADDASAIADAVGEPSGRGAEAYAAAAWRASQERRREARPTCHVPARTLHTFPSEEALRSSQHVWSRSWQPVRCGGRVAWAPVEATQVSAVTWRHADGHARVTRVTLVECDTPSYTTWLLREHAELDPRALRGNCGS